MLVITEQKHQRVQSKSGDKRSETTGDLVRAAGMSKGTGESGGRGGYLRWTNIQSRRSSNTPGRLMSLKPAWISSGSIYIYIYIYIYEPGSWDLTLLFY